MRNKLFICLIMACTVLISLKYVSAADKLYICVKFTDKGQYAYIDNSTLTGSDIDKSAYQSFKVFKSVEYGGLDVFQTCSDSYDKKTLKYEAYEELLNYKVDGKSIVSNNRVTSENYEKYMNAFGDGIRKNGASDKVTNSTLEENKNQDTKNNNNSNTEVSDNKGGRTYGRKRI